MEFTKLLLVFIEGVLSFLSPCIVPVLPVYLSILSNSNEKELEANNINFIRSNLFKNTILFVLGISSTFFLIGTSINTFSKFFLSNKEDIIRLGGIIILLMGLFYMGYLNIPFLQRDRRLHINTENMNPLAAFILGITFSFGWTPCVGPMLASVFIMASAADSLLIGNLMIILYIIGFTLPFVALSIFYKKAFKYLNKIKLRMNEIKKIGGVILIISGVVMVLGGGDKVREHLVNMFLNTKNVIEEKKSVEEKNNDYTNIETDEGNLANDNNNGEANNEIGRTETEESPLAAPNFKLLDQYGKTHSLSDYKGKIVFLNFWATWCPPCREEMPQIEELYNQYNKNNDEVIILGVATPNIGREGSKDSIEAFLKKEGYSFPVVFDENAKLLEQYYIGAFPTTFIIGKDGNVVNYIPGAMDKAVMEAVINEAMDQYKIKQNDESE